jgi:uncharacterized protein YcnI
MRPTLIAGAALALTALVAPAAAQAHVTVQPNHAAAGAFTRLDVRVPTERDDASTVKVDVQFPPGFAEASYEPVPGWNIKVTKEKLATPIKTDDGEVTEGVSRITWTAKNKADGIPPGGFQDFGLSVQVPGKAGDELTFKALQTYSNGEIVRWIGGPGSDTPAPVVSVTGSASEAPSAPSSATPAATVAATPTAEPASTSDSSDSLAITALIIAIAGLIAGVMGLMAARRGRVRTG